MNPPKQTTTALLTSDLYKQHITGPGHPERPDRLGAVLQSLKNAGLLDRLPAISSRQAADDELHACHTPEYVVAAKRDILSGASELSTGDTNVGPRSLEVALHAAGGIMKAVDAVVSKQVKSVFCAVRPPGHHATAARGMGFCVFNNVALGARYAQKKHGVARVLIADWDVHHGNGTQDIFYRDGSVFFFSTHQSPWYPGTGSAAETGEGEGKGTTLNCPFPAGSGRKEIMGAFKDRLLPAMEKFRPDLVMVSAGFDSRVDDPLGRFTLTDADFADLTRLLLEVAAKYASSRLVSVLEGGYNLSGLASAATAHVEVLSQR